MQRLLLPFAVGFLAALAVTMSFSVLSAGRAAAVQFPADSLVTPADASADSVQATTPEPGIREAAMPAPMGAAGADADLPSRNAQESGVRAGDNVAVAGGAGSPGPATGTTPTSGSSQAREVAGASLSLRRDSTTVAHERRLARTFGAMGSKDAARVLEQLSDADIGTVLGYLNERQAAGIMSNFDPERAARLGERALRNSNRANTTLDTGDL